MRKEDVPEVVALQRLCFPAPFPIDLLWNSCQLATHLRIFPAGQFVAELDGRLVGSASSTRIAEQTWRAHLPWSDTVGGDELATFDPAGTTLYGMDISVHPDARGQGVARMLYEGRFQLCLNQSIQRFGTTCRLPEYAATKIHNPHMTVESYAASVARGESIDPTMTPLLRLGLTYIGVIQNHMEDVESGNAAAILEKTF